MGYSRIAVRTVDSACYLDYSSTALGMPCIMDRAPWEYGPVFSMGKMAAQTYFILLPIDNDTGYYYAGTIMANSPLVLNGSVRVIANPLLNCAVANCVPLPIPGTAISAVDAPVCGWWSTNTVYDTLKTSSDIKGLFTLHLPDNSADFEVSASQAGFYPQSIFTSILPNVITNPPQKDILFELIDTALNPYASVNVVVTNNGVPVESAYVSFNGGRELMLCMYDKASRAMAKIAPESLSTNFYGYTAKDGKLSFSMVSLVPYIDYYYYISSPRLSLYKQGFIRLNPYVPVDFAIDLSTGVENLPAVLASANSLRASPNPFHSSTAILFGNPGKSADISIYDIKGSRVAAFASVRGNSVQWNAANRPSGMYVVKAVIGKKVYTKKILLQK
jgi:hypothetical protein